jgi:hypothetical protein
LWIAWSFSNSSWVKTRSLRFLGNAMPQSKHRNPDMSSYLENKGLGRNFVYTKFDRFVNILSA